MTFQALPVPDADSAPFWAACGEHRLVFQQCAGCGAVRFPPAPVCSRCRSWEFAWEPHDGEGEVYTWVVVHHPIPPSIADETPYVSAIIELDGGIRMPARLAGVAPEDVRAAMPVRVRFRDAGEGIAVPDFEPR